MGVSPIRYQNLPDGTFLEVTSGTPIDPECMLLAVERKGEYYKVMFIDNTPPPIPTPAALPSFPATAKGRALAIAAATAAAATVIPPVCVTISWWVHGSDVELIKYPAFFSVNDTLAEGTAVSVRKLPNSDSTAECTLTIGSIILVHSAKDDWLEVSLPISKPPVLTSPVRAANANVRTQPIIKNNNTNRFWMMKQTASGILLLLPVIPTCFRKSLNLPVDTALRQRSAPSPTAQALEPPFTGEHVLGVQYSLYKNWIWVGEDRWMMSVVDRPGDTSMVLLESMRPYSSSSGTVSGASGSCSGSIDEDFLRQYLTYRTVKDPAKRLLVGAFGGEWTERVLREVMFPMSESEGTVAVTAGEINTVTTTASPTVTTTTTATVKERASIVPPVVTFVTGNAKKLEEVDYILKTYETPFKLISEKVSECAV